MSDFTEHDASRPEAMGLLDTTSGGLRRDEREGELTAVLRATEDLAKSLASDGWGIQSKSSFIGALCTPGTLKLGRLEEEEERPAMKRKRTASLKITLDEVDGTDVDTPTPIKTAAFDCMLLCAVWVCVVLLLDELGVVYFLETCAVGKLIKDVAEGDAKGEEVRFRFELGSNPDFFPNPKCQNPRQGMQKIGTVLQTIRTTGMIIQIYPKQIGRPYFNQNPCFWCFRPAHQYEVVDVVPVSPMSSSDSQIVGVTRRSLLHDKSDQIVHPLFSASHWCPVKPDSDLSKKKLAQSSRARSLIFATSGTSYVLLIRDNIKQAYSGLKIPIFHGTFVRKSKEKNSMGYEGIQSASTILSL
ncbi:hypothetical protein C8J57DRAFT_1213003 [Mycena rebaudengoi]|nr:hypothetical protein C8J57DRAFT_1213003 [Mycena rebaudengoi]